MTDPLAPLAARLGQLLLARDLRLVTAESCTGGWVAKVVTDIAGSSAWFDRGFVTYCNAAKTDLLGVQAATLAAHGAVSERVVREMVAGALGHSQAQVALAVSGIAGPTGGSADKPVGTVWFAWSLPGAPPWARCRQFAGERREVRHQAVRVAIDGLLRRLAGSPGSDG